MAQVGVEIESADAPGWPGTRRLGARRPDVFGFYAPGYAVAAGEAKRGPELWSCRDQIEQLAQALPRYAKPGMGSLLILAVPQAWREEAQELCSGLAVNDTSVVVWSPA